MERLTKLNLIIFSIVILSSCNHEKTWKERYGNQDTSVSKDTTEKVNNDVYEKPTVEEKFTLEKSIKINQSGIYIVPKGKIWDIKYANGINPLNGLDSTGSVTIDCGGFLDIYESYAHECGVVTNKTGEKFKSDKRLTTQYYLNSYTDLYVTEEHQIKYQRGSISEIVNIDQYSINVGE